MVATDLAGGDQPATRDEGPAVSDVVSEVERDVPREPAEASVDCVDEWEMQSFPASDPPQNW